MIDTEFVKFLLKYYNIKNIKLIIKFYKNDKNVIMTFVKLNGYILKYVSKKLKNDNDVVLQAVKNLGNSLKFANSRLLSNKKI